MREVRSRIGYMPETDSFVANMTAVTLLRLMGELSGLPAEAALERAHEVLFHVGLGEARYRELRTYSLGMKQRLAIAGVLALRPQCIIADEATSQLDPLSRREITALLHQLHQELGLTIIQVTHLLEEAALAQRVIVMDQGRIVMEGTPSVVFSDIERLRQLSLAIPEPIELADRLRASGITISREALTVEAIAREISR